MALDTMVTMPTHPTARPTWSRETVTETRDTTTADRKANATPCTMRNALIHATLSARAQPKAAAVNRAAATTRSVVLLSLSATIPVKGRTTSEEVATRPATKPPVASDAPSKTTYPVMTGFSM